MPTSAETWWSDAQEELAVARLLKSVSKPAQGYPRQAYLHAGQAVEFALKAIYLRRKRLGDLPDELKSARGHDLKLVAELAGLGPDIAQLQAQRKTCYLNWLVARDWDSNARFPGKRRSVKEVSDLITAVGQKPDGIIVWLETVFQKS